MTETATIAPFICPGCSITLDTATQGRIRCPQCYWTGEVYTFAPRIVEVEAAALALPEDATCLHHPRKKAVAVCAGTGDYVCSLCAIELNGQTYSADYLNGAGKEMAGKAFDRVLPRPDSRILLYMLLCFIPYVNVIFITFAFIWIPHAVFLYFKAIRLRRDSEILRRVIGRGSLIAIPILLGIFSLAWIGGVIAIIVAIMQQRGR